MSMADTYILASKARAKLTKAAQQPDHNLRVLVSHANMLDNLMEKIQTHRESILDGSYAQQKVSFSLPQITHVKVDEGEELDYDSDESDDEDDESFYYKATQVEYDSDEDDEYESLSDISDEEEEEEEEEEEQDEAHYTYHKSHKFRKMPTIDEMTELELDDLSSQSESESEDDEETDITDLKRTPSLVYSTTEDDDSDDDEEEELQRTHHTHTHSEYAPSAKGQDPLKSTPSTHGDLLLENLESDSFTQAVLC